MGVAAGPLEGALDMMVLLLFLLLVCCACQDPHENEDQYNFSYQVEDGYSGNQFGHSENRLGSATAGAYHVLLPDGRVQTVEYTVDSYAGYKATVQYQGEPVKSVYLPVKPVNKAVHHPGEAVYKAVYKPAEPEYNQIHPVPFPVTPAYNQLTPVKTSFSHYKSPPQHQTSFSVLQPMFVPFKDSPAHHHHPSYNSIYDPPTISAPYILPQAHPATPILYQPQSYQPAPVQNHLPIHNLLVRPPSPPHHKVTVQPHVTPLSAPEHKKHQKDLKPDPFLVSEEELRGRDFSGPFWYPLHPKIVKGYRKEGQDHLV